MRDLVTIEGPAISFPVGYHELHPDVSVNFKINRFDGWVGDDSMLTEMREAASGVQDYPTLTTIFLELGDKALARRETLKAPTTCVQPSSFFSPRTRASCPHASALSMILSYFQPRRGHTAAFPMGPAGCPPIASPRHGPRPRSSYSPVSTATSRPHSWLWRPPMRNG
jgi:hypothetical protein